MTDPLISADWLAEHLNDVVVVDATYFLLADPGRSQSEFDTIRIPGARFFNIDKVSDENADLPHMLPDDHTFSTAMSGLGIDGTKPVVIYDRSKDHFSAPRVWFTLTLFGLKRVYVLNGGLNHWIASGNATTSGPEKHEPVERQTDWILDSESVQTGEQVKAITLSEESAIFDARSQGRFDGTAPEPRPGLPSGHMPGSTCVPYVNFTDSDGLFLSPEKIAALFGEQTGPAPVVTCGSGVTACVLALALARIGKSARLYDGSWVEWGQGKLGPVLSEHTG